MKELLYDDVEDAEVLLDDVTGTGRWSLYHRLVFKYKDVYYETGYSVGATEYQDEGPWEYEDQVECTVVEPYEKVTTEYRPVKD